MSIIHPTQTPPVIRSIEHRPAALRDELARKYSPAVFRDQVAQVTLPFWFDHAFVPGAAGYRLGFHAQRGLVVEPARLLVSQARLLWVFARAHRLGYRERDYLAAAHFGFTSILRHFADAEHGGFAWSVREDGFRDLRKVLYAHSFAIYAFVEFARAQDERHALDQAIDLFRWIDAARMRTDSERPDDLLPRDPDDHRSSPAAEPGVAVLNERCANTALHWMEALTELYIDSGDPAVEAALLGSLSDNRTIFFPHDLRRAIDPLPRGTRPEDAARCVTTSYGHNVEAGWLILDAERALGLPRDDGHLLAMIDHALAHGFDHERGGLFSTGDPDASASDRGKVWWVQAEFIAALCTLLDGDRAEPRHLRALQQSIAWYFGAQMDASTGSPLWELDEAGGLLDAHVSRAWQAGYHDLRARWILIDLLERCSGRRPVLDRERPRH